MFSEPSKNFLQFILDRAPSVCVESCLSQYIIVTKLEKYKEETRSSNVHARMSSCITLLYLKGGKDKKVIKKLESKNIHVAILIFK